MQQPAIVTNDVLRVQRRLSYLENVGKIIFGTSSQNKGSSVMFDFYEIGR